nr:uncharacterized protein LOC119159955 [Rhipicephalus microplus]
MTFTFGVLHGAGIGTALLGFSLYILLYFDKYSGTAFAVMWVFRAVSGMAGTQLLWHLANAYGIEGCLLITGGLLLHVVPFTMLIKYPRPTRLSWCASAKHREKNTYNPVAQSLSSKANQVTSTCSHVLPDTLSPTHHPSPPTSSFASVIASMRTWSFYVALFYSAMCEYLFVTFNATVVAYGVDKGCSLVDSKQLVTYNSMGLLVGRVVIPFTTEKLRYRHCPGVVASFLAAAICFVVLTQVVNVRWSGRRGNGNGSRARLRVVHEVGDSRRLCRPGMLHLLLWCGRNSVNTAVALRTIHNRFLSRQERIIRLPLRHARHPVPASCNSSGVTYLAESDLQNTATGFPIPQRGRVGAARFEKNVHGVKTQKQVKSGCVCLLSKH